MSLVSTWERRSKSIHTTDSLWVIGSDGESCIIRPEAAGNRRRYVGSETYLMWLANQILDITEPGPQPTSPVITPLSSRLASVQAEALRKSTNRLEGWRNTIVASERERYRKMFIDM